MKKIAIATSLVAIAFAFTAFIAPKAASDGTPFEGIVTYTLSVDNQQYAQYFAGSSMKVYVKGTKRKSVSISAMYNRIEISDASTNDKPINLVEAGGNKYQLKDEDTSKTEPDPVIKYVDGSKTIAGYVCKKAQVSVVSKKTGQTNTVDVYYTDQINATEGKYGMFKGLKGFALEFTIAAQQGMNITFSATDVKQQSVPDNTFAVPNGYKLVTQKEMMADMQKNMGGGGN